MNAADTFLAQTFSEGYSEQLLSEDVSLRQGIGCWTAHDQQATKPFCPFAMLLHFKRTPAIQRLLLKSGVRVGEAIAIADTI